MGPGGALFSTTSIQGITGGFCGIGCGSVLELMPPSKDKTEWTENTSYLFQGGSDGDGPEAVLYLDSSGMLFGTTVGGGGGVASECDGIDTPVGCGTEFKLTPPAQGQTTWTENVLYAFSGGTDGALPHSRPLVDKTGAIYGTTSSGGLCENGYTIVG